MKIKSTGHNPVTSHTCNNNSSMCRFKKLEVEVMTKKYILLG